MEGDPQENLDLLRTKNDVTQAEFTKPGSNGVINNMDSDTKEPPDGGMRAYSIVVASFLINGLLFGVINSYSVIYKVLQEQLYNEGIANSESRACKFLFDSTILSYYSFLTNIINVKVCCPLSHQIRARD